MRNAPKLASGFMLLFVLSAGCIGERSHDKERTSPVQHTTAPETTAQKTPSTPSATVKFSLTSEGFEHSGYIPEKYTCDGKDVSPPLSWAVPQGAKSLTLIVDDPDAPRGIFTHWVLFNLPANITSLPERMPNVDRPGVGGIQGNNDFGEKGYNGPCPPAGKPHTYRFILYALDAELNLKPAASRNEVLTAMEGHVLMKAELDGKYGR